MNLLKEVKEAARSYFLVDSCMHPSRWKFFEDRHFVFPFLVTWKTGWGTIMSTRECRFYFRLFGFFVRAVPVCRMGGSMRSTSYTLQFRFGKREREFSFCWRPDVTHHYWVVEKRLKNRTPEETQKAIDNFLKDSSKK